MDSGPPLLAAPDRVPGLRAGLGAIGLGAAALLLYPTGIGVVIAIPLSLVGAALAAGAIRTAPTSSLRTLAVGAVALCVAPILWFGIVAALATMGGTV